MNDAIQTRFELLDERFRRCDGDAWIQRLVAGLYGPSPARRVL